MSLEQATPPAQVQWLNCQPVDGAGRFAVAPKFIPQAAADCEFAYVLPQAVIVPGDVASTKFEGADWKVTDSSNAGGVVEDELRVIEDEVWLIS